MFEDGRPVEGVAPQTPGQLAGVLHEGAGRLAVLAYDRPSTDEVHELARSFGLHTVLVDDLLHGHQRPKIERFGETLFIVLRAAAYIEDPEDIVFTEFHVLVQDSWIVILRQGDAADVPWLGIDRLRQDPEVFRLGPEGVLYTMIDMVVDAYFTVLDSVSIDVEEIERQVFSGDAAAPKRIYRLSREVVDLQHATTPLVDVVNRLRAGFSKYRTTEDLQAYLQDAADHLERVNTRVTEIRDVLAQILTVNATLVGQRQNDDMRTISAWAAILFAPTLVGAVYGMNFDEMPELHWAYGYPAALIAMVVLGVGLYLVFKSKRWL